jgi:fructan beta-fructosidase
MCLSLISGSTAVAGEGREDILIEDFEAATWGGWTATGEAFGFRPAPGTLPGQMPVTGYRGRRLANSYVNGDGSIGTLTSPPFKIERRYINFLIGGGRFPGRACVNLLVDRAIVRRATGTNNRPGGSERLDPHTWDVSDLIGRTATIQIVDRVRGPWGHVTADHFVQSDTPGTIERRLEMVFDKRYLNLPVKNGAAKRRMKVIIGGQVVREFEIELADSHPDFYVFLDVTAFQGMKATLDPGPLAPWSRAPNLIRQSDTITGSKDLYREKYRPQFHFTSRRGWNNDSNGLVWYKGEYHLYYQHNPYGIKWGNMHWGHAVSTDLVHWKELPIALYPQRFGDWVFSGSAVVDEDNTAGFQTGEEDVIVAAYTSTGRGECIAYSNDRGRTFTDYAGNPVVEHRGRDPKVIWYEPGGHWVMAVYHEVDEKRTIAFYTSDDLKHWEYQSLIDGFYECPEIFELAVDGDASERTWVLYAADGDYMLGSFDGKVFSAESGKHTFSHGNCFYASQTYNNIPASDGRRIQIAWGRVQMPGMPFNQMMLFPVELTLRTTGEGVRMFAEPVREIARLHGRRHAWQDVAIERGANPLAGLADELVRLEPSGGMDAVAGEDRERVTLRAVGLEGDLFHIRATVRPEASRRVGFVIRGVEVAYDAREGEVTCLDKAAPLAADDGTVRLELLVDRTSIEIFGGDGRVYMPMGVICDDQDKSLAVFAEGGRARVDALVIRQLESAWR